MEQLEQTQDLLHEQISDALNGIDVTDIASEESAKAVDNSIKLVDREIEIEKIQNDREVKLTQIEADKEVKLRQIEEDKQSRKLDRIINCCKFAVGLIATSALTLYAYAEEKDGNIITTQQGKRDTKSSVLDFINRFK